MKIYKHELGQVYPKKLDLMSIKLKNKELGYVLEFVPIDTIEVPIGTPDKIF